MCNLLANIFPFKGWTVHELENNNWKWTESSGHLVAVILCKCEQSFRRYRGEKRHTLDMEYLSFFLILFLRADSLCLPATEWDRWRGKCWSLCMRSAMAPVSTHTHTLTLLQTLHSNHRLCLCITAFLLWVTQIVSFSLAPCLAYIFELCIILKEVKIIKEMCLKKCTQ